MHSFIYVRQKINRYVAVLAFRHWKNFLQQQLFSYYISIVRFSASARAFRIENRGAQFVQHPVNDICIIQRVICHAMSPSRCI